MNLFDVMGPIMVGPSSSHTAGAVRIGQMARKLLGNPPKVAEIYLHGSFADTGKGHGTDRALVAGLLGMETDNPNIPISFSIAKKEGLYIKIKTIKLRGVHPNSVLLKLKDENGKEIEIIASSLGGGKVKINAVDGLEAGFSGEHPTLVIRNEDKPGMVAEVTLLLSQYKVNIATMQLYRNLRGEKAVMVIESDQPINGEVLQMLRNCEGLVQVTYINMNE